MDQLNTLAKEAETSLNKVVQQFNAHPNDYDQTYLQHMSDAMEYGMTSCISGAVFMTHAVFPFLFEKTGSDMINNLNSKIEKKKADHAVKVNAMDENAMEDDADADDDVEQ